jgi:O-antigen ligase
MAIGTTTLVPDLNESIPAGDHSGHNLNAVRSNWTKFLDPAIFGFLLLFAIALPHSIKGAERAWKIAFILWLLKVVVQRVRPLAQPLVAPLLAFVTLSAISTLLSPDPYLSWDRMKIVCLVLVGVVFAQNLKRLSQTRWLLLVLALSGLVAALYTGWQYTYGVGVRLVELPPASRLSQIGFAPGDVITSFGGSKVHTGDQLLSAVEQTRSGTKIEVHFFRGLGFRQSTLLASSDDFLRSGLGTSAMKLDRGKPIRAQGTLGHYVVFAEMLMQIGCMVWALMLAPGKGQTGQRLVFGIAFAGITAAMFATETRAAVVGLVVGCLLALLLLIRGTARFMAVVVLSAILAGAVLWIQHTRRSEWADRIDIGTHFRVLMWEDGIRLIREHPWFGVGMETVRAHYREWNIRGFIQYNVISHFHSTFLQIAVERGIPALLAWLWFCVAYCLFLLRLIRRLQNRSPFARAVAVGVLASFTAFTLSSFVHYNLGEEPLAMILFFYYGLAAAMDRMIETPDALDV